MKTASPDEMPQSPHQLHEILVFDELISAGVYEFMYVFVPVPFKGATGSPGSPIAVY